MGQGRWSQDAWNDYAGRYVHGRSREEVFSSRRMAGEFDPALIGTRESRDSAENPQSTP